MRPGGCYMEMTGKFSTDAHEKNVKGRRAEQEKMCGARAGRRQ